MSPSDREEGRGQYERKEIKGVKQPLVSKVLAPPPLDTYGTTATLHYSL